MTSRIHKYELTIIERHLDTFGHVNNATYLALLEEARWDWIHANGYGLDEILRRQQGPTILEINIRFMRELRNRVRVTIETSVEGYESKVGRIRQRIVDDKDNLYCEALVVFGLFDLRSRKLVPPTERWLAGVGLPGD